MTSPDFVLTAGYHILPNGDNVIQLFAMNLTGRDLKVESADFYIKLDAGGVGATSPFAATLQLMPGSVVVVPEPAKIALAGGLALLGFVGCRRSRP